MFSAWTRTLHEISIFHHPGSPPSVKALALLRSALSEPYPPGASKPLQFNLEVVESPPTADQLGTILSYLPSKNSTPDSAASVFLSAHPSSASAEGASVATVSSLGRDRPNAFKWPVVVDWNAGKASVGDVEGVKGILELLRQRCDGELPKE
ncbi:thioredoxin-like protein [Mycena maculata]|uniref:Thioredoxin-like protein n=1 Tax=Mycena maculata TaxID=230809 RepID=A0AAD7MFI6_9AGAR|nr:thioredoxin-like protein [Mycena maculata]